MNELYRCQLTGVFWGNEYSEKAISITSETASHYILLSTISNVKQYTKLYLFPLFDKNDGVQIWTSRGFMEIYTTTKDESVELAKQITQRIAQALM
jgi:hypothetical protein